MSSKQLIGPAVVSGVLFCAYLLLRPYGDVHTGAPMAQAFASPWWVVAHTCGALGLAAFAWLTISLADLHRTALTRWARRTALGGVILVLPYYGVESVGLHEIGRRATTTGDLTLLDLADAIRMQPLSLTLFGLGLLLLAAGGILLGLAWQRHGGAEWHWAAWPLGVLVALVMPQFALPPAGRMAFGVLYLAAALLLAEAARRRAH